jgi:hypothetical protein
MVSLNLFFDFCFYFTDGLFILEYHKWQSELLKVGPLCVIYDCVFEISKMQQS